MRVESIPCRTILIPTGGFLRGFTHTINPYHGCSLGRSLCGVPDYAPEILRVRGETRPWGTYLDVKAGAAKVYDGDYDRIRSSPKPELRIFMSSVTDPYPPQERRLRATRALLDRMLRRPPDLLAVQTHTPNPIWDLDLLVELSRTFPLSVQVSVETDREDLGPHFPRHAYSVARRLEALRAMRLRGLEAVGVVAPLWPIEDLEGFAARLDEACSFVVVDHYLIGDGSPGGARTCRRRDAGGLSFPERLAAAGHEAWTRLEALERVISTFRRVMGEDRVGVSKEGFVAAAHRLLKKTAPSGTMTALTAPSRSEVM